MNSFLVPVTILVAISLAVILFLSRKKNSDLLLCLKLLYSDFVSKLTEQAKLFRPQISQRQDINENNEYSNEPDLSILNCRIQPIKQEQNNNEDAFNVEICGSIHTRSEEPDSVCANLRISILDITDGIANASPVQTRTKNQTALNTAFSYDTDLGKLPHQVTTLSDWTVVARIPFYWLIFARKGQRKLQFEITVVTADSGQELAGARTFFTHENQMPGYIDIHENIERTKTLTVALAFTVGAADGKLYDSEIKIIKDWARENLLESSEQVSEKDRRKLDKALNVTIAFFREGNKLNTYQICREAAEIAPIAHRYDILDLCLHVAQANSSVSSKEITLLKEIAEWLDIDADRFRLMMEKFLPIDMYEIKDIDTILGITSDMSNEKARKHLNKEYSKWNSRVTNSDPHIQSQADQMLRLIAEARCQYITK
jgi:uncharacterized tellurite resistance protein B-like protein